MVSRGKVWVAALLVPAAFLTGGSVAVHRQEAMRREEEARLRLQRKRQAWEEMKVSILGQVRRFNGESGIVIEDLETGWRLVHQPRRAFPAASVIKVPMMTACFSAAREGKLDLSEKIPLRAADRVSGSGVLKEMPNGFEMPVSQLIDWMITRSDNTAANILISRLGKDYFNRHFQREGLKDTRLVRKMMDFSQRKNGVENFTTAEDMASILKKIYRLQTLDPTTSQACLRLLKNQKLKDRIPAQLPPNIPVAHKTGLERAVCHDAGIVFTPHGDFIVCVLTKSPAKQGSKPAKKFIAGVAATAYRYKQTAS